jgi:DNA-binding GntR family transcriptional regulator
MRARGHWVRERLVDPVRATEHAASDQERVLLSLLAGEMVYRASRTECHDGRLVFEQLVLPAALFPGLTNPVPSVGDLAQAFGLRLGEAMS